MPRKPAFDRDALIVSAKDLFWKQGWAGTSLKDLERALQVKPGSFYAAFGSKDALFALALDRYIADGLRNIAALVAEKGALGALQAFPKQVISAQEAPARACMLSKTVIELRGRSPELETVANRHLTTMENRFAEIFAQAQAQGEIGTEHDPQRLARRYQSDLLGLRVTAERSDVDAAAIAQEIADGLARL